MQFATAIHDISTAVMAGRHEWRVQNRRQIRNAAYARITKEYATGPPLTCRSQDLIHRECGETVPAEHWICDRSSAFICVVPRVISHGRAGDDLIVSFDDDLDVAIIV